MNEPQKPTTDNAMLQSEPRLVAKRSSDAGSARQSQPRTQSAAAQQGKAVPVQSSNQVSDQDGTRQAILVESANAGGPTWYGAIPGRLWFAGKVIALPFTIAGWVLDKAVSALVVGAAVVIWACFTQRIPDDQVSSFLAPIGGRLLAIISKAGML